MNNNAIVVSCLTGFVFSVFTSKLSITCWEVTFKTFFSYGQTTHADSFGGSIATPSQKVRGSQ